MWISAFGESSVVVWQPGPAGRGGRRALHPTARYGRLWSWEGVEVTVGVRVLRATARHCSRRSAVRVVENTGSHFLKPVLYFVIKHFEDCLVSSLCPPCPPAQGARTRPPAQHRHWGLTCDFRCPLGIAEILHLGKGGVLSRDHRVGRVTTASPSVGGQLEGSSLSALHPCL